MDRLARPVKPSERPLVFAGMPRISRFHGVDIAMHYDDHPPPHFHAAHGGEEPVISLAGELLQGRLPAHVLRKVRQGTRLHGVERWRNWNRARTSRRLVRIDPLR